MAKTESEPENEKDSFLISEEKIEQILEDALLEAADGDPVKAEEIRRKVTDKLARYFGLSRGDASILEERAW